MALDWYVPMSVLISKLPSFYLFIFRKLFICRSQVTGPADIAHVLGVADCTPLVTLDTFPRPGVAVACDALGHVAWTRLVSVKLK